MSDNQMIWTDFLPSNCVYCHKDFCAEHATPSLNFSDSNHLCDAYKASIEAKNGRSKNTYNEMSICGLESCNTKLVSPIRCTECGLSFCTYHYHTNTHNCKKHSRLANQGRSAASNNAGLAALKRLGLSNSSHTEPKEPQSRPERQNSQTTEKQSKSVLSNIIPNMDRIQAGGSTKSPITSFKNDKRSKSERDSQLKALLEREKKGILSSNDKYRLAEFRALENQSSKGKECKVQ
ncbi:hypothetical protein E3P91_01643 [Wallemia ichthyophaga]|uniref:AN1-type domain-containing protein n=1 Tax=Wallemia ichthyophaga TaxID=245174 RepID=A0A4T0EGP7_WALIC|nr:hypothetical protein E3P91_01643 [Wallemia ichthyophaga]TIB38161.1 hypothetical protein E3P86_01794 [Wallemia ichthyophaga]TIB66325.1 hypothetical protein E3P78_00156 [Wallemia ichthyophaga]